MSESPFDDAALDTLVSRAETLLVYPRPDVEVLAWNLALAIRQLRAEVALLQSALSPDPSPARGRGEEMA